MTKGRRPLSALLLFLPFLLLGLAVLFNVNRITDARSGKEAASSLRRDNGDGDAWDVLESAVPSAPVQLMRQRYLGNRTEQGDSSSSSCHAFPQPWDLLVPGRQFQLLRSPAAPPEAGDPGNDHLTAYLYSAHYDDRAAAAAEIRPQATVRILALIDRIDSQLNMSMVSCLLWNREGPPVRSEIVDYRVTCSQEENDDPKSFLQPYMVSCGAQPNAPPPEAVSLVGAQQPCGAKEQQAPTNCLKVQRKVEGEAPSPGHHHLPRLALCVKGLSYPDPAMAPRLAEWLELQSILGVDKIFLHHTDLSPEAMAVVRHYALRGVVEPREYVWAGPYLSDWRLQGEYRKDPVLMNNQDNMVYNDCFYTAMEQNYDFVAIMDPDEVIMPLKHQSLPELLAHLDVRHSQHPPPAAASYNFRNTYFMDDMVPTEEQQRELPYKDFLESVAKDNMNVKSDSLHMLGHLVRTKKHIEKATPKAILRTSGGLVQTVMAHFHSSCIGAPADMAVGGPKARRQGCPVVWVEEDLGHLAHYRNGCNRDQQPVCDELRSDTVVDAAILRFRERLVDGVGRAMADVDGGRT